MNAFMVDNITIKTTHELIIHQRPAVHGVNLGSIIGESSVDLLGKLRYHISCLITGMPVREQFDGFSVKRGFRR